MTAYDFNKYKKVLLNTVFDNLQFIGFIGSCIEQENEINQHVYHKVTVYDWIDTVDELADIIKDHYSCVFLPVHYVTHHQKFSSFYTCNLNLILQAIRSDFKLPYHGNSLNIDVMFNDKSSLDLFGSKITLEEIVSGVLKNRLTKDCELDLSNFPNDSEFVQKSINFYKVNLLSMYKRVMLRIAPSAKSLNLSNNDLVQIPSEILNFFVKGDLIDINLSFNKIPSMKELVRVSSRIEKLWIEGNPLCSENDAISYLQEICKKFPRLKELDGIAVNEHGFNCPFWRNYTVNTNRVTRMFAEKFISLYFTHYDSKLRRKIEEFYDENARLTISTNLAGPEHNLTHYGFSSYNLLQPEKKQFVSCNQRTYDTRAAIIEMYSLMPDTIHDPTTFTVDVLKHDRNSAIVVVDGIFKEIYNNAARPDCHFQFRRTFLFNMCKSKSSVLYVIRNEMFTITFPTTEQIDNSFKRDILHLNTIALVNPSPEDINALCRTYGHLTKLKRTEVEYQLRKHNWDIIQALQTFSDDLKSDTIPLYLFKEQDADDISDDESDEMYSP